MSRRISYPWYTLKAAGVGSARDVGSANDRPVGAAEDEALDPKYQERLLQYIPGEVLAFFIAASALADSNSKWWGILIAGAVGVAFTVPDLRKMTWWTVPLALVAYVAWAFGTTEIDEELFGMDPGWSALILVFAVFLVPLIDRQLTKFTRPG